MSKKNLVAYFSASGVTAKTAKTVAEYADADLFEIKPKNVYTSEDLNWMNKKSRSSVEMADESSRPEIAGIPENSDKYEVIFIGFPVWWYIEPRIIDTFIDSCNLNGKTVIPFATSGGSGIQGAEEHLKKLYPDIKWKPGALLNRSSAVQEWINKVL